MLQEFNEIGREEIKSCLASNEFSERMCSKWTSIFQTNEYEIDGMAYGDHEEFFL